MRVVKNVFLHLVWSLGCVCTAIGLWVLSHIIPLVAFDIPLMSYPSWVGYLVCTAGILLGMGMNKFYSCGG